MNIPKAVRIMLTTRNTAHIKTDPSNGTNDTRYSAKSVKYPNSMQFISCNNLFLWNLERKIRNWIRINAALKIKVVIPMLMLVIKANEYDIELIGVVPSVDMIENATPRDIINNPTTKKQILLIIY